jgi:hypothetical protein
MFYRLFEVNGARVSSRRAIIVANVILAFQRMKTNVDQL